MVYVVDYMLPKEYFAHNLRALTVDMAVFRKYLSMKLPKLSTHLVKLQQESLDTTTGRSLCCASKRASQVLLMQTCCVQPCVSTIIIELF